MKTGTHSHTNAAALRLDIWLWSSRFYKSRKLATEAVKGGHVSVNGQKGKPAKLVKAGDVLLIKKFPVRYTIIVQNLSERRLSASLAANLYQETEESIQLRQEKLQLLKNQRDGLKYDRKKPDKKDRIKMLKVKRQPHSWDQ